MNLIADYFAEIQGRKTKGKTKGQLASKLAEAHGALGYCSS